MDNLACVICGYVYDPLIGDLENDIAPNTSFRELPAGWLCPICGVDKKHFEVI